MGQFLRRYRRAAYIGLSSLVAAAFLVSFHPIARVFYDLPAPVEVAVPAQLLPDVSVPFPALQEPGVKSADVRYGHGPETPYYTGENYLFGRPGSWPAPNYSLTMPDLPLADLQGISPAISTSLGDLSSTVTLEQSLQNLRPAQGTIERLKPLDASINGVQLRMLGAVNAPDNALTSTLPSVPVPAAASGAGGLLRR